MSAPARRVGGGSARAGRAFPLASMRISVVLLLILSIGGAVAPRADRPTPTDDVALVGARSGPGTGGPARGEGDRPQRARCAGRTSAATASRWLRDGTGRRRVARRKPHPRQEQRARSPRCASCRTPAAAQRVLDHLRSAGLTPPQALSVMSPKPVPVAALEPNPRNTDRNRGLIVIGLLALFTVMIFYGQAVAQGVTEEKSSRVVELLLTTVTPRRLLTGQGTRHRPARPRAAVPRRRGCARRRPVGWRRRSTVGCAESGRARSALVHPGLRLLQRGVRRGGALVSRQEDLSTAIVPITIVMTASFYLALIVANGNPNGTLAQIAAFVPPVAPMVVPARMVLGNMTTLGLILSVAVDLIATAGLILLAGRIYERAILRVGAPVNLRRLFAIGPAARTPRTTTGADAWLRHRGSHNGNRPPARRRGDRAEQPARDRSDRRRTAAYRRARTAQKTSTARRSQVTNSDTSTSHGGRARKIQARRIAGMSTP